MESAGKEAAAAATAAKVESLEAAIDGEFSNLDLAVRVLARSSGQSWRSLRNWNGGLRTWGELKPCCLSLSLVVL